MGKRWLCALLAAIGLALPICRGQAMEITCVSRAGEDGTTIYEGAPAGACLRALIKGPINLGDAEQFTKFIHDSHPYLDAVDLWSRKGDDGMKIGLLVRKEMLLTRAPSYFGEHFEAGKGRFVIGKLPGVCEGADCVCYSACFLIWSAGVERSGTVVGFHRPTLTAKEFREGPGEEAASAYRYLLSTLRSYLLEMEIPINVIEVMTGVSSTEIIPRIPDSLAYDLKAPPSVAEWITASCGTLTRKEWLINLSPSLYFEGLVREIQNKAANIARCSWKKRFAVRQAAVAP